MSDGMTEEARKTQAKLIGGMNRVGLLPIAKATGVDDTTVGRWKGKEIPRLAVMIDMMGYKLVPKNAYVVDSKTISALVTLSAQRMEDISRKPNGLIFDDADAGPPIDDDDKPDLPWSKP